MNVAADRVAVTADKIILALDQPDEATALQLVEAIPGLCWVKVGLELFTASGPDIVLAMRDRGLRVFLDLKFHDIPSTMAAACRSASRLGAELITVHGCAGSEALAAAQAGAAEAASQAGIPTPTLLAVTVLTSWNSSRFATELAITEPLAVRATRLAELAAFADIGGAVCSPLELKSLRDKLPEPFTLVTPGIRPHGFNLDDQRRVMAPAEAIGRGANLLVIGRPISEAANPADVFKACCIETIHDDNSASTSCS